jgi:hypothetical protein
MSESPGVEMLTFDLRRNLINILGEDHYPLAEFVYHELAANAYDEDAQEVHIVEETIAPETRGRPAVYKITISDDGNGMDLDGLKQYFLLGESSKPDRETSERFRRTLIGRLGVGKVSILKVARRWRIVTERHLTSEGGPRPDGPVRLMVDVQIDDWINGLVQGFPVHHLHPTGRAGTEITLEGVEARLRKDRIQRQLQRLPLNDDFRIWRQNELIPPRTWFGQQRHVVNREVRWTDEAGNTNIRKVQGEIWVREPAANKKMAMYIDEPENQEDSLRRDPAGIEVRVGGDLIVREFFGKDQHAHQVNRIWGWVDVPWLPILGNRTDFVRDRPESREFYQVMQDEFEKVYNPIRRASNKAKRKRDDPAATDQTNDARGEEGHQDSAEGMRGATSSASGSADPPTESIDAESAPEDSLANRYGEALYALLEDQPEWAPTVDSDPVQRPGRPSTNRIYPLRAETHSTPFEPDAHGDALAVTSRTAELERNHVVLGSKLRSQKIGSVDARLAERRKVTAAGIRLRFLPLGVGSPPYEWILDPEELELVLNSDHPMYRAGGSSRSAGHRMLVSTLISLALLERQSPAVAAQALNAIEGFGRELFDRVSSGREV